jgi:hypothetical protein
MPSLTYASAREVAPDIHALLAEHLAHAIARGEDGLASLPAADTIAAMIDAAFWASLRREETYVPRISLAAVRPEEAAHPLRFFQPLPLTPPALARVAPAVERPGVHLGVSEQQPLAVWGIARALPKYACVIEVAEPGLLVVKQHRGSDLVKYANLAVLQGDHVRIVDEQASSLPDCPPLLSSLLGFESPGSWVGSMNVLVQIAVSMRAHGRGGLLLVVPTETAGWRDSIVQPVLYGVDPPFTELATRKLESGDGPASRAELARTVDAIAGLTAVDGATVLTADHRLLAFGAKVTRRRGASPVEQVMLTEPIQGGVAELLNPAQLGGTRHLAAAQFVHDQRDAVALVASQDGRFTIFAWSACEAMVHAHRVEALLL